jgi:hypothetical protein
MMICESVLYLTLSLVQQPVGCRLLHLHSHSCISDGCVSVQVAAG